MKKIIYLLVLLPLMFQVACTDVNGDGIETYVYEGTTLPEASNFRNPVWEPDLSHPSVMRGTTQYFAFGDQKEWESGLNYNVPVLSSNNLMTWSYYQEAFSSLPDWADEPVSSVSVIFAKLLNGLNFMAYTLGDEGIGMAFSKAPQGPYTDFGRLFPPDSLGFDYCHQPCLIMAGINYYLFFETEDGNYGVQLTLSKTAAPKLAGDVFKVTGTGYTGLHVVRKTSDSYYMYATTGEEGSTSIVLARATSVDGPYLDKDGNSLLESGNGTLLVQADEENGYVAPGHVGGLFTDYEGYDWILFQVENIEIPLLSTGAERNPMMFRRMEWDGDGWPVEVISATPGWMSPKFKLTE